LFFTKLLGAGSACREMRVDLFALLRLDFIARIEN
jgi:hypothetical protein